MLDLSFNVLRLPLASHVACDLGLDTRVGLRGALAALLLRGGADLYIVHRLADKLCAPVILNILLRGGAALIHHAEATGKRDALLHLCLLNLRLGRGSAASVLPHWASHALIAF